MIQNNEHDELVRKIYNMILTGEVNPIYYEYIRPDLLPELKVTIKDYL